MSSRKTIVLDRFLRIGDRVVMQMDKEARSWGRKGVPDGTAGTVIGFHRYESYVPRIGGFGKKPGRYMCNGGVVVHWDNDECDTPDAGDLRWEKNHRDLDRVRRADKVWNEAFEINQFMEPLPELPFWEHDIVRDKTGRLKMGNRDDNLLRISTIEYHHLNDKRDDGSPMPIYNVEAPEGRSGYTWTNTEDLELVERGNVWKWFNGERAAIKWKDLKEEATFHRSLGLASEIRNPRTMYYTWDQEDVINGLQCNLIDAPAVMNGFFGAGPTVHCYRFHDRELGERVRAEALKGFTQQPSNS